MLDCIIMLGAYFVEFWEEVVGPVGGVLLRLVQVQEVVGWNYVVVVRRFHPGDSLSTRAAF